MTNGKTKGETKMNIPVTKTTNVTKEYSYVCSCGFTSAPFTDIDGWKQQWNQTMKHLRESRKDGVGDEDCKIIGLFEHVPLKSGSYDYRLVVKGMGRDKAQNVFIS